MFGDTMLVNGTVYPKVTVEPRRYRLRILNACNARFLNLQLYVDSGSGDHIFEWPRLERGRPRLAGTRERSRFFAKTGNSAL